MPTFGLNLPEYPWEQLAPYREIAEQYQGPLVNLSIGTPIDSTPSIVRDALVNTSDAHGYPTTHGTLQLRESIACWYERRRSVTGLNPQQIMPTVGSKELIAWLPFLLGLGAHDVVVRPRIAYPTYDIGAQLAGAQHIAADSLEELDEDTRSRVKLIWVNSPSNPTGAVTSLEQMRALVEQARDLGAIVASDECYAELGWGQWDAQRGGTAVPSLLDSYVTQGRFDHLLSVYSLSKQSNMAGYRAAFVAGDEQLILNLVNSRKHAGMIVPAPVQSAMIAALDDDQHVQAQKDVYRARRERLLPAVQNFGIQVEESEAGLYLWGSAGEDTWSTVERFARLGILVGPGVFYGSEGEGYVRIALTGSDEDIDRAVERLRR
ncbi:succinyldiaminopimelate transaminase [Rothia sp. CCM 9418]|uniref:succinyldiaminopimelate transaminase n=1 Tax=Rothia sp. CCM 9418 TaxID=3402661 RepID=UPI003ADA8F62